MIYVFAFLGEFGYELLNWQGVIRKLARTLEPTDRLVCCGRSGTQPLYPDADLFVDISGLDLFRASVACSYFPLATPVYDFESRANRLHCRRLKRAIRRLVLGRLGSVGPRGRSAESATECRFVFSSDRQEIGGCVFGARRSPYDPEFDIYELLDVDNNLFERIEPVLGHRTPLENRLGLDLEQPFILCQTRKRSTQVPAGSHDAMPVERLLAALAERVPVVLISFDSGRALDSGSSWQELDACHHVVCRDFSEQSCLIHYARACLFATEGDIGSHIYLPPLFGHDVFALAPWTAYQLGTSPFEFWNANVFRFGGQVVPWVAEDVFGSRDRLDAAVETLVAEVRGSDA